MTDSNPKSQPDFDWRTRFLGAYYDDLPHWVVEHGRYAVTLRCNASLPSPIILQLEEQKRLLQNVDAKSEAAENARRKLFLTLDGFLDLGQGFSPFREFEVATLFHEWLGEYKNDGLTFSDFVIMPNHLHLITRPIRLQSVEEFKKIWMRFKGRSSRFLNQRLSRHGKFWQTYGYDRWIRNEKELRTWQRYLSRNPIKAGLSQKEENYPFLQIET